MNSTPRNAPSIVDFDGKKISVPYTPVGSEALIFKYYCPLCMLFFKEIMKSGCCGNYICMDCFTGYLQSKGIDNSFTKDTETMLKNVILEDITCPHCLHNGFQPSFVGEHDEIRDYSRKIPILQMESIVNRSGSSKNNPPPPSPLRIGESFEDLKRKMIPYKLQSRLAPVLTSEESSGSLKCLGSSTSCLSVGDDTETNPVIPLLDFEAAGRSPVANPPSQPQPEDESVTDDRSAIQNLPVPTTLFEDLALSSSSKNSDRFPSVRDTSEATGRKIDLSTPQCQPLQLESTRSRSGSTTAPLLSPSGSSASHCESPDLGQLSEASPVPLKSGSEEAYEMSTFSLNLESSATDFQPAILPRADIPTREGQ